MKIVSYISSIKAGKRSNSQNPITAALDSIVSAANNSGGEFVAYKHEGTHSVGADVGFCFGSYKQRKLEVERAEIDGTTKRWVADARSGSWLAANVRHLTLVFLTVSYVAGWDLGYPLENITGLLTIVIGGYFGSRGVEKVFGNNKHK